MKGFFEHIKFKYDTETCMTMKYYCKQGSKLAKHKERLKFLLGCKEYDMLPKHLENATAKLTTSFSSEMVKRHLDKYTKIFMIKVLNLEIKQTNITMKLTEKNLHRTNILLKEKLYDEDHAMFIEKQLHTCNGIAQKIHSTHTQKLNNLKDNQIKNFGFSVNTSWFVNQTSIEFPEESKWLLSLGTKFAIPINHDNFSPIHAIADVEQYIQKIEDDREKDIARSIFANRLTTFKRKIKNSPKQKFILKTYEKTRKFLHKYNKEIIVTTADKGNKTVIMYRQDYNNKMNKMLEDRNIYRSERTDLTVKLQKTNNKIVNELYKQKYIDINQKNRLYCSAASAPRLYGLPKIHKPNVPLRPISSSINVPCYQMSKYIGETLKHIISNKYNIKNAFQLKEKMQDLTLEDDEILVSFDVVSLFTNIPTYIAIKNIMKEWEILQQHTKIPKRSFLKILQFCLTDNNYFKFENRIYRQVYGMPMGNPLSPTVADIVMDNLLDDTISKLKECKIEFKLIIKYVDDILAVIKKSDQEIILKTLNEYNEKLQFTVETEKQNSIPYLDTTIHRVDQNVCLNWYMKPIASGRMINFHSTQPTKYKINTAKNFINKAVEISDYRFHSETIQKIKSILRMNDFPNTIINKLIDDQTNQLDRESSEVTKQEKTKIYFSIPYIPGLTDIATLHKTFDVNTEHVAFAHKSNTTLSKLFTKLKSPIEKNDQFNVVYEIQCKGGQDGNCPLLYIGTTKRALNIRMTEHQADIKKSKPSTALAQHIIDQTHTADFSNVRILDKERRTNTRYTLESLRIQQNWEKVMNTREDQDQISTNYSIVL